jgi:KDO2-lipid IV(A) lauroyltransferase
MLALFRFLARWPLGLLQFAGAGVGLLVYLASPSYRGKLLANLARAGLPRSLRWACAKQAGAMVGELPFVWFRDPGELAGRVSCDDVQVIDSAIRERRGILFLTPHIGAFEMTARYFSTRFPIVVLFKPPRQAALARLLAAARNQDAMRSVPTNLAGVRTLLRTLRSGDCVGLLPDQVPDAGQGDWAPFFGEPAYTLTLPQRLAESTGAAVVLALGERLAFGRGWRLHLERMTEVPTPEAVNAAMQRLILRLPTQYLWGYNRYKRPRRERP